jgi:hypothetical protein
LFAKNVRLSLSPAVSFILRCMSNAEPAAPKHRVIGRPFAKGTSGNPAGRPLGSRNRLADAFVADLAACWERHGVAALEKCATEEPGTLIRTIASLLPKDVRLDVTLDATAFASKLHQAAALLGHDIDPPRRLRKPLPGQPRLIENGDGH